MPYLNVDQVESALAAVASEPNESFTELIQLPHSTHEGRICHAIKIANGSNPGRVGVYFIGGVHAREWGSPDILIFFIQQLVEAYREDQDITLGEASTFTEAQIQDLVNKLDIFVFPQVNPDGRNFSMTTDSAWRKNRRPAPSSHPNCPGVDINRNYDFLWDYPNYFDPAAPVQNSKAPCDYQIYIGPEAASEPETQNVVSMFDEQPNIRFFIDVHSYSEKILYDWGDDQSQTNDPDMNFQNPRYNGKRGIANDGTYGEYTDTSDEATASALAHRLASSIRAVRGRPYEVESSFALYPTAGTSTDYAFSRHLVDQSKEKVYSYTIEWGSPDNPTPFHPPYAEMQSIIKEVTAGLLDFCLGVLEMHTEPARATSD